MAGRPRATQSASTSASSTLVAAVANVRASSPERETAGRCASRPRTEGGALAVVIASRPQKERERGTSCLHDNSSYSRYNSVCGNGKSV
eukprot:1620500-Prymnesium_polylepis.1